MLSRWLGGQAGDSELPNNRCGTGARAALPRTSEAPLDRRARPQPGRDRPFDPTASLRPSTREGHHLDSLVTAVRLGRAWPSSRGSGSARTTPPPTPLLARISASRSSGPRLLPGTAPPAAPQTSSAAGLGLARLDSCLSGDDLDEWSRPPAGPTVRWQGPRHPAVRPLQTCPHL